VLAAGLEALAAVGGGGPAGVTALIGPSAGPCCYEVGEEVHAALRDGAPSASPSAAGAPVRVGDHADLWAAATARLRAAGVARIHAARECTICAPDDHFSHRRDAGTTGRQAGMAWLS
jgi:copper oxidase (laccase) domain-containing protein